MSSSEITQLKVDDEPFLVASLIDRCPKTMMLRELVQNAIEAATEAPAGKRRVEIGVVEVEGARKLRIWNTGPGMDEPNLYRMCDIASSIGKLKGLDRNFGMGAKVASLPSNHHGLRYRSCANGLVHEMIIGKRHGVYGRIMRPRSGAGRPGLDRMVDILEISDLARREGYDLSQDWTEVALLGMGPDHDTAAEPYNGDPEMGPFWLPEALYGRFFRFPEDIEVVIEPELTWRPAPQRFLTLAQRAKTAFAGYECVTTQEGLRIHYFHDPATPGRAWENASSEGALQTAMGQVGIVYREEIYDRTVGSPWAHEAPNFGVTFGGRHVSVFIELPDDYPVRPDAYRMNLMKVSGDQSVIQALEFAQTVRKSRPRWFVETIEAMGGGAHNLSSAIQDLARLSGTLNLSALQPSTDDDARVDDQDSEDENAPGYSIAEARAKCGFGIALLRDAQDINDRWLNGRAACFYPSTKQLFVNTQYPSIEQAEAALRVRLSDMRDTGLLDEMIRNAAIDCVVVKVGRALLHAMAKHFDSEKWHSGHIEKAMSPETLSIVADDLDDLLPVAERKIRDEALMS